ncbi:MAG: hypothetical protein K0S79_60 [Nitrospira sp.]|jgi:hypothetical protein|nr:hypothetical protein [Nitrospira sp.]
MFNEPVPIVDSLDQWLAVHYGHQMETQYKDCRVSVVRCYQCRRTFVGFPRK